MQEMRALQPTLEIDLAHESTYLGFARNPLELEARPLRPPTAEASQDRSGRIYRSRFRGMRVLEFAAWYAYDATITAFFIRSAA